MPTPKQIAQVRNNFRALTQAREAIFLPVYEQLAAFAPEHDRKYDIPMLARAVRLENLFELSLLCMDHPTVLFGTLHRLGRDYAQYGSWMDAHELLTNLILNSLAQATRELSANSWTEELAEAWRETLHVMVSGMIEGAKSHETAAQAS